MSQSFHLERGFRISSSWPPLVYTIDLVVSQNNPGPNFSNYFFMCAVHLQFDRFSEYWRLERKWRRLSCFFRGVSAGVYSADSQ
jgi:hypothetical protein